MSTITITLPEEKVNKIREIAKNMNIQPEDLVKMGIEDLISIPEAEIRKAMSYVLNKNMELYVRLA
jgi:antitoxin FitA